MNLLEALEALEESVEKEYQEKAYLDTDKNKKSRIELVSCHMAKRLRGNTEFEEENISEDNIEALASIADCLDRWVDTMIEKGEKNGN